MDKNLTKKQTIKKSLLGGLSAGFIYSLLDAGFNYSQDQDFSTLRFLINMFLFGTLMGIVLWLSLKKQMKDN